METSKTLKSEGWRALISAMLTQVLIDARAIQHGNASHFDYVTTQRQTELELNKQERSIRQFICSPELIAWCRILEIDAGMIASYAHEYLEGDLGQDFENRLENALKVSGAGRRQPHGKVKEKAFTC